MIPVFDFSHANESSIGLPKQSDWPDLTTWCSFQSLDCSPPPAEHRERKTHLSLVSVAAKPVRPGHYPPCWPSNPFFLRGYNEHPFAFYKAPWHVRKNQEEAEPDSEDANSNPSSPAQNPEPNSNDTQREVQDNM